MTARHPEAWVYLHAAVQQQQAKVRDKQWKLAPAKLQQERDRLEELKRRLRERGKAWWLLVALCVMAYCSIFVVLICKPFTGTSYIYSAPTDTWRVLVQVSDYEFVMQRLHNGVPLPPQYVRFCNDYKPRIQIGYTLTYFAFDDRGECISIKAKDRQYNVERAADPDGRPGLWPTLPDNCKNLGLGKPVVCDGLPQWKGK